jgi:hypothetical protein
MGIDSLQQKMMSILGDGISGKDLCANQDDLLLIQGAPVILIAPADDGDPVLRLVRELAFHRSRAVIPAGTNTKSLR